MKKIILAIMALAGLCACSSDDVLLSSSDDATAQRDVVYFKFNLTMADVTRSETDTAEGSEYGTSTGGEEYGQDTENQVNSLTVVLVDSLYDSTIATEYVKYPDKIGTNTYVVTFEKKEVTKYADQPIKVFIYCNHQVEEFVEDEVYNTDEVAPWTDDAFYMSNAVAHSLRLPSEEEINYYNNVANPIDLGTVKVERSVARFDYKDGASDPTTSPFTYPAWYDDQGGLLANFVISDITLINMSNNFYAIRHMAENVTVGTDDQADLSKTTILSTEMPNNWVIDTDASDKINYDGTGLTDNFTYLLDAPSTWEWTKISSLTKDDNNNSWDSGNEQNYHIWRYATENTIPSVEAQQNGISTGIVFKVELQNVSSGNSYKFGGADGKGRVYVYENNLYESWEAVAAAAAIDAETGDESYSLRDAYLEVMDVWTEANQTEYSSSVTRAMEKAGFTGYSPDEDGKYYIYYYYWNKHNDNGNDGIMGIMEFAVVRNNVYKLSVTDINGFGHATPPLGPDDPNYDPDAPNPDPDDPNNPDPDPNNPDPDPDNPDNPNPDETDDVYLKVDVEILPWVVRENDIKF